MTTKTYTIFVPMSSIAACYFQEIGDRSQIRCKGDADGNIFAHHVQASTPVTPEIATATFLVSSRLEEEPPKTEEKPQASSTTQKKTESKEGKKEEDSEDTVLSGGTFRIAHLPLPSTRVVYLAINLLKSNQYAEQRKAKAGGEVKQELGSGLVYDFILDEVYPPPGDLNWDAYFVPYVFECDGEAIFDSNFNSFKLKPYVNLYFDFEVNPDSNSQ